MRQQNISPPTVQKVVHGARSRAFGPDIVEGILSGSFTLTSTLLEHGLAGEMLLVVYPVLLGTGKRFFAGRTPPRSFG